MAGGVIKNPDGRKCHGQTCHGKTCARKDLPMPSFTIRDLERRVQARASESAEVSYTRKLLDRGVDHCAKKFGEEAVEAAIAAVGEDRQGLVREAADVLYHLLVVLHARGISLDEVEAELGARSHQSGLEEKAARKAAHKSAHKSG